MAVVLHASGTQSATVTTEHFLSSPNVVGKFSLQVDLSNMVAGDVVELRCYKMVLASGTQRVAWVEQFSGVQPADALILVTDEIANTLTDANAVRFSLKQTFGTSRSFPWAVYNTDDSTELKPTTAGRTLDVSATGEAGIDWANVGSPTTTNNLTGTTVVANVTQSMGKGLMGSITVGSGSTTTSVVSSACTPAGAIADQFKNRSLIFAYDTTTTTLRGAAVAITASSNAATPTFTVSALPAAPASGDVAIIV